jgi:LysM repeat protein
LQPMNTGGETSVSKLAESAGLTVDDFKKYNLWINGNMLPDGRNFIYYLPRKGKREMALLRHVTGTPHPAKERPESEPTKSPARFTQRFPCLESMQDKDNGIDYVIAGKGESLVEIAVRHGVKVKRLKEINGYTNASWLLEGDIVYLKPAQARHFHIVQEGETLDGIAKSYGTTSEKLRERNRMPGDDVLAYQKLSLKKRVAKGSNPVFLCNAAVTGDMADSNPAKVDVPKPAVTPPVHHDDPGSYRLTPFESNWVMHTAVQGESLWKIARRYGAFSEVVKKINELNNNELKPGTTLKVLQVTDQK